MLWIEDIEKVRGVSNAEKTVPKSLLIGPDHQQQRGFSTE
jgi:hypothetical protein